MIVALVIGVIASLFNAGVASSYRKLAEAEELKLIEEVVEEAMIAKELKLAEAGGAHIEANNQESVGEKFTDCNTTCNEDHKELLTHTLQYCEHAIDNPSANLYNACVQGTVRAYVQNCHLICSKAGNLFSSNEGCSGIRVKYWCKKVSCIEVLSSCYKSRCINSKLLIRISM
jgi:hypothetical protein